ncbi:MAG: hypothetical protein IIA77_09495 [Proteobacteria bacterium]|nr:hypothetical protein [Pseudomonadota bacterium]
MKDIRKKNVNCMLRDRESLAREYKRSNSPINDALQKNLDAALVRKQSIIDAIANIDFLEILPVSVKRNEITTAIKDHNA